jgi:hypothetical protein
MSRLLARPARSASHTQLPVASLWVLPTAVVDEEREIPAISLVSAGRLETDSVERFEINARFLGFEKRGMWTIHGG